MSVVSLRCTCPYFRTLISRVYAYIGAAPAASLWPCAGLFYIGRNLECGLQMCTDGWCGVHFACAVSEMILTKLVQDHGSAPGWAAVCSQFKKLYIYEDLDVSSACTSHPAVCILMWCMYRQVQANPEKAMEQVLAMVRPTSLIPVKLMLGPYSSPCFRGS